MMERKSTSVNLPTQENIKRQPVQKCTDFKQRNVEVRQSEDQWHILKSIFETSETAEGVAKESLAPKNDMPLCERI